MPKNVYKNKQIKSKNSTFLEGSFRLLLKEGLVVRAKIQTFVDYPPFRQAQYKHFFAKVPFKTELQVSKAKSLLYVGMQEER